ncbi:MAG: tetratricopeptide repeat protein, partial [Saprospiraceae bacterium]|nr:tetratricopeptide repeat protein [Saprospiraceae bacterium]
EEETGYKINNISKDSITYHVALNSYKDNLYEKAIGQFESYISKFNSGFYKTDAYYYLAESFVVLKNYKSALHHYEKVLEQKGSTYYASSLEKAALIAFNHSQDFSKSLRYYSELIEMNSEVNIDYLEAALYSAFKTQDQNSVINYGQLLIDQANVSPESKSAANYYLGKTYYNLKESEKAKNAFLNVVSLSSNNQAAESSYLVAKILFEQGQFEAAEEAAFETTSKAANYPIWVARSLVLLGDIFKEKKDYLNASAAYESVIENFTDNPEIVSSTKSKLDSLNELIEKESRVQKDIPNDFMAPDSIR